MKLAKKHIILGSLVGLLIVGGVSFKNCGQLGQQEASNVTPSSSPDPQQQLDQRNHFEDIATLVLPSGKALEANLDPSSTHDAKVLYLADGTKVMLSHK